MKRLLSLSFVLLLLSGCFLSNAQTSKKSPATSKTSFKVEVYYFHFTQRCQTCHAVEDNARRAFETLYADKIKKGEYSFKGVNLDDATSKTIAQKLNISGQTLLVVCGGKKADITDKGFMNAHNPDKMKAIIQKAVSNVLVN